MKLDRYLAAHNITRQEFAARIDVKQPTLHRYLAGLRIPRPEIAERIRRVTEGAVTANDFVHTREAA